MKHWRSLPPMRTIAGGFLLLIAVGTLLLSLPFASRAPGSAGLMTSLFTATSASCVTGLVVADTAQTWTWFGQLVILLLIQIGGLGFITFGMMLSLLLGKKIGLRQRDLLRESINSLQIGGSVRLARRIVIGTALFEGCGALILSLRFIPQFGWIKGLYYGVFHAVSAFCNAGFDLMGQTSPYQSFSSYVTDPLVNLTLAALIIVGGIGFLVWSDLVEHGWHMRRYRLHTKIVLSATLLLLVGGTLLYWLLERNALLADLSWPQQLLASFFSSATARTAGFNTIDTGALSGGSKLLTMVLMFIGGSPGSTAGGAKTTTVAVMLLSIWSATRNQPDVTVFGRRLEDSVLKKVAQVLSFNLILAVSAALAISLLQPQLGLDNVLFEVFSAIGTVGMSTGITRELGIASRLIVMFLMFAGRVGGMTFALSFLQRRQVPPLRNPEEKITVG